MTRRDDRGVGTGDEMNSRERHEVLLELGHIDEQRSAEAKGGGGAGHHLCELRWCYGDIMPLFEWLKEEG